MLRTHTGKFSVCVWVCVTAVITLWCNTMSLARTVTVRCIAFTPHHTCHCCKDMTHMALLTVYSLVVSVLDWDQEDQDTVISLQMLGPLARPLPPDCSKRNGPLLPIHTQIHTQEKKLMQTAKSRQGHTAEYVICFVLCFYFSD